MHYKNVGNGFPSGSIVDVRQYGSWDAVLDALAAMPEAEWTARRDACRQFYLDELKEAFGDEQFVEAVLEAVSMGHN